MIRIIIGLFAFVGLIRGLSFAVWNKKEGNISGCAAIVILSIVSSVLCVMNLLFE